MNTFNVDIYDIANVNSGRLIFVLANILTCCNIISEANPQDIASTNEEILPQPNESVATGIICGRHNRVPRPNATEDTTNTIGEYETQNGEWPHMCAIFRKRTVENKVNHEYLAGASLITPSILLTAAHWAK